MRVFMLGWEFPPFISGGLGTACYGLTRAMSQLGIEITFVLPKIIQNEYATHVNLLSPQSLSNQAYINISKQLNNVKIQVIDSPLTAYSTPLTYQQKFDEIIREKQLRSNGLEVPVIRHTNYAGDMYTEIYRYANIAAELAKTEHFDFVHAHDWMTYPAAIAAASVSGKPLIVHVHSTEFDRSGEHVNQMIYDIEREGMHAADKIIAVSYLTRNIIISRYGITGSKVEVVHNGIERNGNNTLNWDSSTSTIREGEKIVLFLGRITMQKGPEYFLQAAKRVLEIDENIKFVMAGTGDMMDRMVELAAQLGIGSKVLFTGFLRGEDVQKIYRMADLFVMPSVSEPFGLVPLEALDNDVPVIISKQSGVSEVLNHALKVDFWDVDDIANKILAVLKYHPLKITLQNHGNFEVRKLTWKDSAKKCMNIYEQILVTV